MTGKRMTFRGFIFLLAFVCAVTFTFVPAAAPAFADDGTGTEAGTGTGPESGTGSGSETGSEEEVTIKVSASAEGAEKIRLSWTLSPETAEADEYRIYSPDDAEEPKAAVAATEWTDTGLTPATNYTYRVEAWKAAGESEDGEMTKIAESYPVSASTGKQTSTIKGYNKSYSKRARTKAAVTVTVTGTMGSPVELQYYNGKSWITKQTVSTKNTADSQVLKLTYPDLWWKKDTTKWRYVVKAGTKNTGSAFGIVVLKTKKYYQNPKKYVQIKNKISKHGHKYYTSPVLTDNMSTRKQHVNAMIKTAKKYLGDPYVVCRSRKPGKGVDCSGLVMQACYGAGVDLWPSNPWRHKKKKYEYESRYIAKMKTLKTVKWKNRKKGDLIFYSRGGRVMHVAIYIGHGKIIHSIYPRVCISRAKNPAWGKITRVARVFI